MTFGILFQTIYYDDIESTEYPNSAEVGNVGNVASAQVGNVASPFLPRQAPYAPRYVQPFPQPQPIYSNYAVAPQFQRPISNIQLRLPGKSPRGLAPPTPVYSININGTVLDDPLLRRQAAWRMSRLEDELASEQQQVAGMKRKVRAPRHGLVLQQRQRLL